jgi:hypothetical protein
MSLVQSTYGTPNNPGNFEALLLEGNNLVHYWRDNAKDSGYKWHRTAVVSTQATGAASLIQSNFNKAPVLGNFEAVVLEGHNLVHYYRDNSEGGKQQWVRGPVISSKATGPASLLQINFSTPDIPGNLELIVPEGDKYVHYYRDDSSNGQRKWSLGDTIA